jgi:hypothetical protein
MAPIIDQPRPESAECYQPLSVSSAFSDVPGMLADRVGALYANEERKDRHERTERLIREAEALQ